jgi:hypothetical protein
MVGMDVQEHRMQMGSKAIFHLEAFVAKFMSIYKRYVVLASCRVVSCVVLTLPPLYRFLISSMIGFE